MGQSPFPQDPGTPVWFSTAAAFDFPQSSGLPRGFGLHKFFSSTLKSQSDHVFPLVKILLQSPGSESQAATADACGSQGPGPTSHGGGHPRAT